LSGKNVSYYNEEDLNRFNEIGESRPDLLEKFMA